MKQDKTDHQPEEMPISDSFINWMNKVFNAGSRERFGATDAYRHLLRHKYHGSPLHDFMKRLNTLYEANNITNLKEPELRVFILGVKEDLEKHFDHLQASKEGKGMRVKEGDKVILDYDFINGSLVYLKSRGKYFSIVSDGGNEWQVMTDRLWAIGGKLNDESTDPSKEIESLRAERDEYRKALEEIAGDEGESCGRCEGNGKLWADGQSHFPSYEGPTINCGRCGGEGRVYHDLKEIAQNSLDKYKSITP